MGMIDKGVPEICLFQSNDINAFLSNYGMHRQHVKQADPQINSIPISNYAYVTFEKKPGRICRIENLSEFRELAWIWENSL